MALSRVCMKNSAFLRASYPVLCCSMPRLVSRGMQGFETRYVPQSLSCSYSSPSSLSSSSDERVGDHQAASSSSSLTDASRSNGRRGLLWRNPFNILPFRSRNNAPTISSLGSLGNALVHVSDNLNRLLENLSPSRLLGRVKEDDKCYKLRYEVPGLSKKDLKITVEDGFLVINGERKEEEGEFDDDRDEGWYSQRYGIYNASLLLPDDAKVDEIRAEVKDGLLYITIPRAAEKKRNVREVEIH